MKFIVVLACCLALTYAGKTEDFLTNVKELATKAAPKCQTESSIGDDDLKSVRKLELPATHEGKCFVFCMARELDLMTADGKPNKAKIDTIIGEIKGIDADIGDKVQELREVCVKELQIGSDPCETAYSGYVCAVREKKNKGFPDIEF